MAHAKLLKKDRTDILRLKRAIGEEAVVGITESQKKTRWTLSPSAIRYLANHKPVRYVGIPDSRLAMMSEASQALEK